MARMRTWRESGSRALRNHDHSGASHIIIEIPSALVLKRRGVVNFDIESSAEDIQLLSIARHAEAKTRPAGNLQGLGDAVRRKVERPELAAFVPVHTVRYDGVRRFFVGRNLQ